MMQVIFIVHSAGHLPEEKAWTAGGIQSRQRFLPPAAVQRSTGGMCLQRSAILMKIILRIWRISISVIVQGYLGIRTAIARMRSFTMREAGASGSRYNAFKVDLSSRNSIYLIYKNMPLLQLILNLPFLLLGFLVKTLFFIKKGFGLLYLRGLWKGIRLSCSKEGRKHKIPFSRCVDCGSTAKYRECCMRALSDG